MTDCNGLRYIIWCLVVTGSFLLLMRISQLCSDGSWCLRSMRAIKYVNNKFTFSVKQYKPLLMSKCIGSMKY